MAGMIGTLLKRDMDALRERAETAEREVAQLRHHRNEIAVELRERREEVTSLRTALAEETKGRTHEHQLALKAEQTRDEALALLRELEWRFVEDGTEHCPVCRSWVCNSYGVRDEQHEAGCRLAKLLEESHTP